VLACYADIDFGNTNKIKQKIVNRIVRLGFERSRPTTVIFGPVLSTISLKFYVMKTLSEHFANFDRNQ